MKKFTGYTPLVVQKIDHLDRDYVDPNTRTDHTCAMIMLWIAMGFSAVIGTVLFIVALLIGFGLI